MQLADGSVLYTFIITTRQRQWSIDMNCARMIDYMGARGYQVHDMPSTDSVTFSHPCEEGIAAIVDRQELVRG